MRYDNLLLESHVGGSQTLLNMDQSNVPFKTKPLVAVSEEPVSAERQSASKNQIAALGICRASSFLLVYLF